MRFPNPQVKSACKFSIGGPVPKTADCVRRLRQRCYNKATSASFSVPTPVPACPAAKERRKFGGRKAFGGQILTALPASFHDFLVRSEVVALSNKSKRLDLPTLTTAPLRLKGYFRPVSHLYTLNVRRARTNKPQTDPG